MEKDQRQVTTGITLGQVMTNHKKIAGIILAAGDSSRLGFNKLLLDWHGTPLIHQIASQVVQSLLKPVCVVTGFESELVETAVKPLDVTFIYNPGWEQGQSTSIRAAINYLTQDLDGMCFILGDQPFLTTEILNSLSESFDNTQADIVVPYVAGIRANPLIFGRSTFKALGKLQGDSGGKQILDRFKIKKVELHDLNLLKDIDTMDDYRTLLDVQ